MDSRMSKSPPSSPPPAAAAAAQEDQGDAAAAAAVRVTSRLYLHKPGPGTRALEKNAVLRRIRHRRRANRLRDTLRSLLVLQQHAAPEPEGGERPAWLDDAFTSP